MDSPNVVLALATAFALGLRHALDPDHLIAVSTLVAGGDEDATPRAARLGATWGTGHALAVTALGLPIIFAQAVIPELVQRTAETAVGVIIVVLAVRLLLRWRRGGFHLHVHDHHGVRHSHVHGHAATTEHAHEHVAPRTPLQAFAIGVTHGVGGSAAVTLLLLASIPSRGWAATALLVFAVGTAIAMAAMSAVVGWALARDGMRRRAPIVLVPLGIGGVGFGVLYAAAAWIPALALA